MLFLARREISHNKIRYTLFMGLVGLVSFLVFVMTGLSAGLGEASISGLRGLTADADLVVFAPSVQRTLGRSDVDAADAAIIAATPGVDAVATVGQSMHNLTTADGRTVGVALIGLAPGAGDLPASHPPPAGGIVLDATTRGDLAVGDRVSVAPSGPELEVAGFADLGSLQHTPVASVSMRTWQQVRYPTTEGVAPPNRASAFLVRVGSGHLDAVSRAVAEAHLDPASTAAAIAASPGYKEETGTINVLRGFLFGTAALLVGTVFWVVTLQKEASIAVLRAAGATGTMLVSAHAVQVATTTVAGVAAGLVAATAAAAALPATAYLLTRDDVLVSGGLLVLLALVASTASMRRILVVDPLISLGRL